MIFYKCIGMGILSGSSWNGSITSITASDNHVEAEVTSRDSYFQIILGHYKYGNYLCVPNWNLGIEIAEFNNHHWIMEKLILKYPNINLVDVTSIVYAVDKISTITNFN